METKPAKLIKVQDGEAKKMFTRCPHKNCGHLFETVNEVNHHMLFNHVTEPAVGLPKFLNTFSIQQTEPFTTPFVGNKRNDSLPIFSNRNHFYRLWPCGRIETVQSVFKVSWARWQIQRPKESRRDCLALIFRHFGRRRCADADQRGGESIQSLIYNNPYVYRASKRLTKADNKPD